MNQEIKRRWVEALRSGRYKQGKSTLRRANNFCCLGVLCDLAAKEGVTKWQGGRYSYWMILPNGSNQSLALPPQVVRWAGLPSSDPMISGSALSSYNDIQGWSFLEIANLIEDHL